MNAPITDERFSLLFDIACGSIEAPTANLSEAETAELSSIRTILEIIDKSWDISPSEIDNVRALFLTKLAIQEPNHPWLLNSTVTTLGDMVRVCGEDAPNLTHDVHAELLRDTTPVSELMSGTERTKKIASAVRAANVPQERVMDFMLWVNRTMASLFQIDSGQNRYVFTRKQRGSRRGKD